MNPIKEIAALALRRCKYISSNASFDIMLDVSVRMEEIIDTSIISTIPSV